VIRRSGESLLTILNDILDLSKIEAGKLEIEAVPFDLGKVIGGASAGFTAIAADKGIALTVDTGAAEGIYLGDPTRIRQLVSNLVSNALKFTETGEVRATAARSGDDIRIVVSDTGPGIGEEALGRLFEKFVQADSSTTRQYGGTGLGLAICRELAGLMGGTIAATSRLGEGSSFTVTLPLPRLRDVEAGPRAEPSEPVIAELSGPALRVLAAEDNPVNQLVIKALLQHIGVEPVIVENGVDAVAAWAAQDWDLILMDVQMPGMDGPAATRIIRERERASGRIRTPIIALTANAMSHQVEEYTAAGMDGFVAKPIDVASLFAAIEAVLAPAPAAGDQPAADQMAG
jgi:CheY-like chemotaxis protein